MVLYFLLRTKQEFNFTQTRAGHTAFTRIELLSERGITTLVSTHYMDEAARCSQLAFLNNGKLLTQGTAAEIIAHSVLPNNPSLEDVFVELLQ